MTFNDDLAGLDRAGQIARVQAVAREHGDELTEAEAAAALSLYTAPGRASAQDATLKAGGGQQ